MNPGGTLLDAVYSSKPTPFNAVLPFAGYSKHLSLEEPTKRNKLEEHAPDPRKNV
jgi:hypothetical protein